MQVRLGPQDDENVEPGLDHLKEGLGNIQYRRQIDILKTVFNRLLMLVGLNGHVVAGEVIDYLSGLNS